LNIIFHSSNNLEGSINLEFLEADYMPQVEEAIRKYRGKVELKGFRKGQAPYEIVKKMNGPEILFRTVMELVTKKLQDAVAEHKVNLWSNPLMTENPFYTSHININQPGTLNFTFEYGLIPEIDFSKLEEIEVEKYEIHLVSDITIDEAIKKARIQHGTSQEVPQSEAGDILYGTLTSADGDNKPIYLPVDIKTSGNNVSLLGIQPQNKLILQLGPDKRYSLSEDNKEYKETLAILNSLDGEYEFTVEKIYRTIPADLNEEFFFKILGENKAFTIQEFKEQLRDIFMKQAQMAANSLLDSHLKQAVMHQLSFDLPENFIKNKLRTEYTTWNEDNIEQLYQYTHSNLRWSLVVDKFAGLNDLSVTMDEISALVKRDSEYNSITSTDSSSTEEKSKQKVEKSFLNEEIDEQYKQAYDFLLQQKTLDTFKNKIKLQIKKKDTEEFKELLAELQQKM
jgi:trigger factor